MNMPRRVLSNVQDVIEQAAASVVARTVSRIQRVIQLEVAERVSAEVAKRRRSEKQARAGRSQSPEMTRWVADRRARRVPKFVIEATGLDTKKKIVAKYGNDSEFVKGKPLPAVKAGGIAASQTKTAGVVRAKPPIIRRGAGRKVA